MKPLPTFVLLILWPFLSWSQVNPKGQVHGRILDADTRLPLSGASVSLVVAKDSSRTDYSAFSNESGGFSITDVSNSIYRAYISYLGYEALLLPRVIEVNGRPIELGDILLNKKGLTLRQVEIITSKSPFTVRRDTIEYNAGFYKARETSPMEDLLKKLPGVEITPDGTIKVNGQVVDHVLVDGKQFFGTDTRKATQNLLTNIIDKVQIIDRVPDLSNQSVPDNNQTEKVLNIILKKEEHNKIGGIANGGLGYKDRFSLKTSLNRFGEKQQLSFIGSGNNVNEFEDNNFVPNNIIQGWKAGLNYNQDLKEKMELGISYSFTDISTEGLSHSYRQNILPDSSQNSNSLSKYSSHIRLHIISLNQAYKLDSMSNLTLSNSFSFRQRQGENSKNFETRGPTSLINEGSLANEQFGYTVYQLTSLNYTRKFKRSGQLLKIGANYNSNKIIDDTYSTSNIWYQSSPILHKNDSLNQLISQKELKSNYKMNIWYSQPLGQDIFMNFSLSSAIANYHSEKETSDYNLITGKFGSPVDSLSGKINSRSSVTYGAITLGLNKNRYDIAIGANGFINGMSGWIKNEANNVYKQFRNLSPVATLNYQITTNKKLHFDYNQNIVVPEATQLFWIPDLGNPLVITKGNTGLKPNKTHQINLDYSSFNPHTMKSMTAIGNFGIVEDQILSAIYYDSIGRQISIPLNISGAYFAGFNLYHSFCLAKNNLIINTSTIYNIGKEFTFVNSKLVGVFKTNWIQGINFTWRYKELIDFSAYGSLSHYVFKYKGISQLNNKYLETALSLATNINLASKAEFQFRLNFNAATGRADGYNSNKAILNIGVTRYVSKNRAYMVKLQCFDALNQNVNVVRNTGSGYIEDIKSVTMKRFIMFSFIYYIK